MSKSKGPAPRPSKPRPSKPCYRIFMAYCHPGSVRHEFMDSIIGILQDPRYYIERAQSKSSANISMSRNTLVHGALESDCEWFWVVDADMVFTPDVPERLIAHDVPIVSANYYGQGNEGETFPIGAVFKTPEEGPGLSRKITMADLKPGLNEVAGVGMGCVMIKREVIEALGAPDKRLWPYAEATWDSGVTGEDITFCFRAKAAGFASYIDTDTPVGHMKTYCIAPTDMSTGEPAPGENFPRLYKEAVDAIGVYTIGEEA